MGRWIVGLVALVLLVVALLAAIGTVDPAYLHRFNAELSYIVKPIHELVRALTGK